MMQQVYGWLQNTAFFIIFMAAVLNCLPDAKYRRYVRFFMGMVLLIVIAKPILSFFHLDEELTEQLGAAKIMQEAQSSKDTMLEVEGLQEEYLWEAYEREVEQQVRELLREYDVEPVEVRAEFSSANNKPEKTGIFEKNDSNDMQDAESLPKLTHLYIRAERKDETLYRTAEAEKNAAFTKKIERIKDELSDVYKLDVSRIVINRA